MRAIIIQNYGGPENLHIKDVADPKALPGQVIIEVKAFGINRAELYFREGLWGDVAKISGIECVGRVRSDASGLFAVGQRVLALMGGMGRSINGSYAELVAVPAESVVAVDTEMSWQDLAAIPESYATAWTCIHRNLALSSGQTLLVRGATSALGQAAVNIASAMGVRVLASTRKPERFAHIARLGAEPVLDAPDLSTQIRADNANGIDAVLDIVGNTTLLDSLKMLRVDGRACLAGFLGGDDPIPDFNPLMQMPSGVQLSFFASAFMFGTPEYPLSAVPFQDIINHAGNGTYKAQPAKVFEFDKIVEAHRFMESDQANGKIVVRL